MKRKLNPIRVVNNEGIVRIVETKKEIPENITILKIVSLHDIPIQEFNLNETQFIELDEKLKEVKVLYFDDNRNYFDFEILELIDKSLELEKLTPEEIFYNKVKNEIRIEMNTPNGTEIEISAHTELLKKSITDLNARKYIVSKIRKKLLSYPDLSDEEIETLSYKLYADLYGMGVLQELDDDPEVGEIMVNARTYPKFHCDIYYIKNQTKYVYDKTFKSQPELENVFRKAIEFDKKELNSTDNAEIEAIRPNRDRVQIIIPDASENWIMNIRKFSNFVPNMEMMRKSGTIDDYNDKLFKVLINGLANIGIGGYMGTGKTTLINFLLTYTKPITRKVVIASVSETDIERVLKGHDVVILNVNDEKGFTFSNHLKSALRSTADRIVVPESRGEEFKQIYEANLKTSGNLFTGHAVDDEAFLDVCVEMYKSAPSAQGENEEYVKNKLAKSIDIVVIMRKVGNKIRIKSISEVIVENGKFKGFNPLQVWDFDPENPLEGCYRVTGNKLSDRLKMKLNEHGVPMSELKDL